ncbi:hypothetical protein F5X99DRAFT_375012 [Biscogniauxia marginata]|nr:hypothetical protein F5X99DRAFT_375012 [Biscogniauxia marginata]
MTTVSDPADTDITLLCDITGVSRPEAITRLKANHNDIARAIEEYFEDPTGQKYKWDESQFSMDREGETNNAGISFNIQGPDELPPASYQNSAAPTRPPSRTNNRSPLGRLIDFTAQEAADLGAPANSAQEDDDLRRALAESAAESGLPPQEAGVVDNDTNMKYFGPANRPQYASEQWAMVPTKASVEATSTDPTPTQRKREPGAPAFLRQTKDHRVGAVLSIFHKIPAVRNILLSCGRPSRNYGYNSEWWKGQPIFRQEHLAAMARGEQLWGEEAHPDFSEELHRLMAFLDLTDRSYGTVDCLVETKPVDSTFGAWMPDVEEKLFEALKEESSGNPDCDLDPMTTTGKLVSVLPTQPSQTADQSDDPSDEDVETSFMFLDIQLDKEIYAWVNTLYDALDGLLWQNAVLLDQKFPEDAKFAVLSKPADVVTMRFGVTGLSKPCEIPAVFYADRYMQDRKDIAIHLQTQLRGVRKGIQNLTKWEKVCVRCRGQHNPPWYEGLSHPHDIRDCLGRTITAAETLIDWQKKDAQWRYYEDRWNRGIPYTMNDLRLIHTWTGPFELTPEEESRKGTLEQAIQEAKDKIERVNRELAKCKDKKEEWNEYLEVIGKRLTCQEHEADDELFVFRSQPSYRPEYWNPTQKYLLRGVALTNELAYVCVRHEPDLIDLDQHMEPEEQWWKIGYASNDASPIKTQKATLDDVLQAAGTESKYPILVYASEAAMKATPVALPDALRMFVKADNRTFQQELSQEQRQDQDQEQQAEVQAAVTADSLSHVPGSSPAKRKYSNGSSVATHGSLRDDLGDVDLTFSDDTTPRTYHEEFASSSPKFNRLGGIIESLANIRTDDSELPTPGYGEGGDILASQDIAPDDNDNDDVDRMEAVQTFDRDTAIPRGPEMQERPGGGLPFLTRPGNNTHQGPIDMMDLDADHQEGTRME